MAKTKDKLRSQGQGQEHCILKKILRTYTLYSFAKFGWVPFAGLRLRRLTMKWNAEFMEGE